MLDFYPDTSIRLLEGVPLVNDYHDSIDFDTRTAQLNYFMGLPYRQLTHLTYQREKAAIRVPMVYEEALKYNYCMYQNANFSNKWFFAFITEARYVNPEMTELTIELDVLQTWQFDYAVLSSFIEREHTKSDWPFEHNIPEGLEFGPIKVGYSMEKPFWNMCICIAYASSAGGVTADGELIEGVYSGVKYAFYDTTDEGVAEVNRVIQSLSSGGHLDDIVSVFMVPEAIAKGWATNFYLDTYPQSVDGYIPKNKKLFSYPYRYLAVDNYQGQENIYRFELFRNPYALWFNMAHQFNMEAAVWAYPMDYAGMEQNWNEGLSLSNFPLCTWIGNVYANWYARNKYSIMQGYAAQAIGAVAGLAAGNLGATAGAIGGILGNMAQQGDRSLYPWQIQGQQANSTVNIPYQKTGYLFSIKVITAEYAKIIDDFFTRFGYRVNRNGVPDTKTRRWWNYVKTSECKVGGRLPQMHIRKIEEIYNNGVTFWHDPDTVDNFDLDNYCINPGAEPVYPSPTLPPEPPNYHPVAPAIGWGYPAKGWSLKGISSGFGWRIHPITGKETFHYGVDIPLAQGTPLLAMHEGYIKEIHEDDSGPRGFYIDVWIGSSTNMFFRYQHCNLRNPYNLSVGDKVELEQAIQTVGKTGDVTGPHLHLELWQMVGSSYQAIDPTPYLLPNYG